MNQKQTRVLVAMSGGVDSSVAAALLLEKGYEVIGVTMQLWDYSKNAQSLNPSDKFDTCCSLDDVADARMVAHKLGIPFYMFDYQEDFQKDVVDYFTKEYLAARTPNPCVACNTFLKFDHLLERAKRLGCSYVATGHYAQINFQDGIYQLKKGLDPLKDQSYFLYSMTQKRLSQVLFPVGGLTKQEVRAVAEKYGLVNAQKKESMEICFIPNNDYAKFIDEHADKKDIIKGSLYHEDGTHLGNHEGIHHFTIGQRKGLKIAWPQPLYVTRILQDGKVIVGEEPYLYKKGFVFQNFHMVEPFADETYDLAVKIRYRSNPSPGKLIRSGEKWQFCFEEPVRSVTPGQIAVIYQGDRVLGGGTISHGFN